MLKHTAILLALLVVLTSCSDEAVNPGTITVVQAKTGSTFTFDDYNTDTASGAIIPESRDTSVHTVVRTGITFNGKSNVSELSITSTRDTSTAYISYESNGDIAVYFPGFSSTLLWLNFPISSKTTVSVVLADTTVSFFGVTMQTKITAENSYVGTETLTVSGQSISAVKIKQSLKTKITTAGISEEDSRDSFFYFTPSLGYIAKVDQPSTTIPGTTTKSEGSMSVLMSYVLK